MSLRTSILKLLMLPLLVLGGLFLWHKLTGGLYVARDIQAENDFMAYSTQVKIFADENGFIPTTEQGLEALVVRPILEPIPGRWTQLMSEVFKDPWGRDYQYRQIDWKTFEIRSQGEKADDPSDDMVHRGIWAAP